MWADLFFGVDVLRVQEVLRFQQMTVPRALEVIEGLINLRGQIVTAIDLRRRLGLPPRTGGDVPTNMVIRTDDGAVSLLVDEIGDVLDVDAATYERPPENLDPAARRLSMAFTSSRTGCCWFSIRNGQWTSRFRVLLCAEAELAGQRAAFEWTAFRKE